MAYFYLLACVLCGASLSLTGSLYNRKNSALCDVTPIYNLVQIISTVLVWAITYSVDFSFDATVLPYCIIFALGYSLAIFGIINALKHGSAALTSLVLQLSVIGATLWGFFFWDIEITAFSIIGIALVVVSLFLCLFERKSKSKEKTISPKWIFFAALLFLANATATVTQKTQLNDFDGQHGTMFMFFSVLLSTFLFIVNFIRSDKRDAKRLLKRSWYFPVIAGICNAFVNLLVIALAKSPLSPALVYPVIGVGGIMVSTLFSALFLKEKITAQQWCGIAVGSVAVLLLSI